MENTLKIYRYGHNLIGIEENIWLISHESGSKIVWDNCNFSVWKHVDISYIWEFGVTDVWDASSDCYSQPG